MASEVGNVKRRTGLVVILALVMFLAGASTALAATYYDTSDHWANAQIERWSDIGIIQGYNGCFRPSDPITRGEMAVIINRIMNYQVTANNSFSDLPGEAYFAEAILKANAAGVILGDRGKVRPGDYISREEAIVVIGKALGLEATISGSLHFKDKNDISPWASAMVLTMENRGFIRGTDGKFMPKNNISRAEIVTILDNIIEQYVNKAGTYINDVNRIILVNVPGAVLKDITVYGDLVVAPGVGQGEIILDNVQINGNLVVKGGGINSIRGNSNIGKAIVDKAGSEVRLVNENDAEVNNVIVSCGSNDVILMGYFSDIQVAAPEVKLNLEKANITTVKMVGEKSRILLDSGSNVGTLTLSGAGIAVSGGKGAMVKRLFAESTACSSAVSGDMTLQYALIKADNVSVDATGGVVNIAPGVSGAIVCGKRVAAATTVNTTVQVPTPIIKIFIPKIPLYAIAITGEPKVGDELTAVVSPSGAKATYQWRIAATADGTYAEIAGATKKTYTPVSDDAGKFIKVIGKGIDEYTDIVRSPAVEVKGIKATDIDMGTSNPSTKISISGDTFAAGATNVNNWIIDAGATGLAVKTIKMEGEAGLATSLTIDFEGTAAAGTINIRGYEEVFTSGAAGNAVNIKIVAVVDKKMLTDKIRAANSNLATTRVSIDGSDVLPADMWVSSEIMAAYATAIAEAQAVDDNEDASQTGVDDALAQLEIATSIFDNAKVSGQKIVIADAASFTGNYITSNTEINANGLNIEVSPAEGYHFIENAQIIDEIKTELIDGMEFDYTYGLVDQNTGAVEKDASQKTNLTNLNNITSTYFAKTEVSLTGFSDSVIEWLREYDDTQKADYKIFSVCNNKDYLSDRGRLLAAGLAIKEELKTRGNVEVNSEGNLIISCDNNGYLKTFTNVIRLVNGNQKFVFGDLPVSLTIPASLVKEGTALKTVNTFDILETKAHVEVWEYVDDCQAGEAGVIAVNTIYDNGSSSIYSPAYAKSHYIKRVAGDLLTEEDVRNGGTSGPNGTGNKLIKVVVDGRTGPTWWAFKKPDAQFIYNSFRTNITIDDYTLASTEQTPQDDLQWLKIENEILVGGPLDEGATFNGFNTTNIYLFNTSADNRFDEYDVHDMWYTFEIPTIKDFEIDEDLNIYVNQLCGLTGGSGGGGSNPQGSPFWGMDGRCCFTIKAVD